MTLRNYGKRFRQPSTHSLSELPLQYLVSTPASERASMFYGSEFERLTADLLDRTETTTQLVLRQSHLTWDEIDRVLLVGGAERECPWLPKCLDGLPAKSLTARFHPTKRWLTGRALCRPYHGKARVSPGYAFTLVNVNSHSLGIIGIDQRAKCDRNVVLIPKNTPLPCRAVRKFATARDNQGSVKVRVVEGESERPEHCIQIGECVIRNLPPGLPKGTKIEMNTSTRRVDGYLFAPECQLHANLPRPKFSMLSACICMISTHGIAQSSELMRRIQAQMTLLVSKRTWIG